MAYIGKQPVVGNFVKLDAIVTSATATYNLLNGGVAYSPQSANNCIVSLNGIIQEPTSSGNVGGYTISGSTIVFTSALTALDVIDFILVLGDTLSIGTPSDGTVSFAKVTSNLITGATSEATIDGADSVLIYDDSASALRKMTRTNFVAGVGGVNTPAFYATASATQSNFTTATEVKINYAVEEIDTASAYDTSTSRFTVPSGQGGKYFIYGDLCWLAQSWSGQVILIIKKNGSQVAKSFGFKNNTEDSIPQCSGIFSLSASDYVEIFAYHGSGSTRSSYPDVTYRFYGYKLIE
jgi:hypothetical protein